MFTLGWSNCLIERKHTAFWYVNAIKRIMEKIMRLEIWRSCPEEHYKLREEIREGLGQFGGFESPYLASRLSLERVSRQAVMGEVERRQIINK